MDADGDLDLGSNDPNEPTGFFAVRSPRLTGWRSTDEVGNFVFTQTGSAPTSIPNGTEYRIVTTLRFFVVHINDPSGTTILNFRPRASTTGGFWSQDATEVITNEGDILAYTYTGGQPFTDTTNVISNGVTIVTPEPSMAYASAIAGARMMLRRRR
jgi:hypothetical protein